MSWRNECVQYVILLKSGQIVFHLTGQDKIQKVILLMERSFISVVMKFLPLPHGLRQMWATFHSAKLLVGLVSFLQTPGVWRNECIQYGILLKSGQVRQSVCSVRLSVSPSVRPSTCPTIMA